MPNEQQRCRNCEWFDDTGICRRYPPEIVATTSEHGNFLQADTHWPVVLESDFCGEFHENVEKE